MIRYVNDIEIKKILDDNQELIMVFAKGLNCGVCQAAEFRINNILAKKYPFLKIYYINIDENPLFRGQHLIFTFPTIMLFDSGSEVHRESRIIDFYKLETAINAFVNDF